MDPPSERYVMEVARVAQEVIGRDLVGVYVHGSAVLGGYDRRRSDIDVLIVCHSHMTSTAKESLARELSEKLLPCPAVGLELSVVTLASARHHSSCPAFELHLTTAPKDSKVVDGRTHGGDADLVLHYAVCRAAGRLIGGGLSPKEAFADIPQKLVRKQLYDELAWGVEHAPREYAVLNACRAWLYSTEGRLVSKIAGGEWALQREQLSAAERAMIEIALVRQRDRTEASIDENDVKAFAGTVRSSLADLASAASE